MYGFCNVWMCGCFGNRVGVLVICVLVFAVFVLFMYIYSNLLLV